jgi:hypothetical protein
MEVAVRWLQPRTGWRARPRRCAPCRHIFIPVAYFHDITGLGQSVTNNGLFPVTKGYDEATGIGTPNMAGLIVYSGL